MIASHYISTMDSMRIQVVNDVQRRKKRLDMMRRAIEYEAWLLAEQRQAQKNVEYEVNAIQPPLPLHPRTVSVDSYHSTFQRQHPYNNPYHFGRHVEEYPPYNNLHQQPDGESHYSYSSHSTPTSLPPLEVRRTDRSTALWNTKFEELKAFKAKYGTCNVPQCDPENKQLGVWLRNQRTGYNLYKTKGKGRGMTKERIQMLESLGVEWRINAKHVPWQQRFEELKAYAKEHGHCSIPGTDMKHKQLCVWLRNQRKGYSLYKAKGKGRGMTEERIRLLESIGVEWETRKTRSEIPWMKRFDELKAYKAKHGTFNIHHCDDHHKQLARWLSKQRAAYKLLQETGKGPMSDERMKLLNSIGVHL